MKDEGKYNLKKVLKEYKFLRTNILKYFGVRETGGFLNDCLEYEWGEGPKLIEYCFEKNRFRFSFIQRVRFEKGNYVFFWGSDNEYYIFDLKNRHEF